MADTVEYLRDLSVDLSEEERKLIAAVCNHCPADVGGGCGPYLYPADVDGVGADWLVDEVLPWAVQHAPDPDARKACMALRLKLDDARKVARVRAKLGDPDRHKLARLREAVVDYWGERCTEPDPTCECCKAWEELDIARDAVAPKIHG